MFVRNHFEHDARVTREAEALVAQGMQVFVFAVARTLKDVGVRREGDLEVVRVFHHTSVLRSLILSIKALQQAYRRFASIRARLLRRPARLAARAAGRGRHGSSARAAERAADLKSQEPVQAAPGTDRSDPLGARALGSLADRVKKLLWPSHQVLAGIYFCRVVASLAATVRPVAYHCHDQNTTLAGYLARRIHEAPVIYDSHELYPHRNRLDPTLRKRLVTEAVDRFFSRRCDAVITVNRSIAEHMRRRYGLPAVHVVMNTPLAEAADSRTSTSLDHVPRPRLFYSGALLRNRGLEEALAALPALAGVSLVVLGPGRPEYLDELEKRATDLGVRERVFFVPPVPHEEVAAVGAQADIAVVLFRDTCLSYRYSLPNKFFEALHAGLAVVASDLPELRRIIEAHDCGTLCESDDPMSIAAAVKRILEDPEGHAQMRRNAKAAADGFRWEREREKLLDVYRELGILAAVPPVAVDGTSVA